MVGLAVIGLAIALYSGHSDYEQGILMSSLKEGEDFTKGQLSAISQMLGTPKIGSVNDLKGKLDSVRTGLERYAMPRALTDTQKDQIANYLRKFEPHNVTIRVQKQDQEAMEYAAQITGALFKGGWKIQIVEEDLLNVGLGTDVAHPYPPPATPTPDPNHPMPDVLIAEAFKEAKVDMNFGQGENRPGYVFSIEVARRPLALALPEDNGNSN